jgi:hypothetical protein
MALMFEEHYLPARDAFQSSRCLCLLLFIPAYSSAQKMAAVHLSKPKENFRHNPQDVVP